ncbi:MAG: hypothetical protein MZV63_17065 [Marinilabiliales bacterium]|nr:hypothetical protein [Marinilabiliales bacterium]
MPAEGKKSIILISILLTASFDDDNLFIIDEKSVFISYADQSEFQLHDAFQQGSSCNKGKGYPMRMEMALRGAVITIEKTFSRSTDRRQMAIILIRQLNGWTYILRFSFIGYETDKT